MNASLLIMCVLGLSPEDSLLRVASRLAFSPEVRSGWASASPRPAPAEAPSGKVSPDDEFPMTARVYTEGRVPH